MKKTFKIILGSMSMLSMLALSCKLPQASLEQAGAALPSAYQAETDSLNLAKVDWRTYFAEPQLIALIDTALIYNQDYQIALQRIQSAQAGLLRSRGQMLPTLEPVVSGGIRRFGLYTMDGAGNISTEIEPGRIVPIDLPDYYLGLQTKWELDIWAKLKDRKKAAFSRVMAGMEGRKLVMANLVAGISSAYYELKSLDQQQAAIDEAVQLQTDMLDIIRTQKAAAVVNELAVKQAEVQLKNIQALKVDIRQQVIEQENRIRVLQGRFPEPVGRDTLFHVKALNRVLQSGMPSDLLAMRPDIRQAEALLLASRADLSAARKAFYPSFNMLGSIGYQAFEPKFLFRSPESLAYTLLGNLTSPLINRSGIKAAFNEANAAQLEALYGYQKTVVDAYTEVQNELSRFQTLNEKLILKTDEQEAASKAIEISRELFKAGRANYMEVLLAQQNNLQTKLDLIGIRKSQMLHTVNLYKALGGGWD
jgi:multidrug efflux system outer membrane protein